MNLATTVGAANLSGDDEGAVFGDVRHMTSAEFRELGLCSVAYLRRRTLDGAAAYAIHAADGTAIATVEDIELAVELASENGMTFVAVH